MRNRLNGLGAVLWNLFLAGLVVTFGLWACSHLAGCAGRATDASGAPSPVGYNCGTGPAPEGYADAGPELCAGAVSCGARPPNVLRADLPDQAVLLPPAPEQAPGCSGICEPGQDPAGMFWVWIPAGTIARVSATTGRTVATEPWRCNDSGEQTAIVAGGQRGARAWVLAQPAAPAGWVRVEVLHAQ